MRKDKNLSRSSVKDNSRIPKPVSVKKTEVKVEDNSTNSRNLRSNSRTTPYLRPIRINRDCLKGVPDTSDRVIKRNRPFTQRVKSAGSSTTPNTSEVKPRAPVPRITSHSCVKTVISTSTAQIPKSTRVLRSAVPKDTSSVHSSKTDTVAITKVATTNNTSTRKSTRTLRSHVSSPRDPKPVTTSSTSKIPKFSWNLRSRSSFSECKTKETQSLRKRGALKVAETTCPGKRVAVGEVLEGDLCSKKQLVQSPEPKTELKESEKSLELRPEQSEKKAELPSAKLEVEEGQHAQLDEQQPCCIKESTQELDLEKSGIALVADHLDERPLTPEDSEVKILDAKELQGTPSKVEETIPSVQAFTAPELPLTKEELDEPVTLAKVGSVKAFEVTSTPLANEVPETVLVEANDETIKTALPKEIQPSTLEQAIPAISEEKPASPQNFQAEISPVITDNISAVKPRLEEEVTLKTSEVLSLTCRDESSVAVDPTASTSGDEATLTTSPDTTKAVTLVEAAKTNQHPDTKPEEPATVVREKLIPETPPTKPTNVPHEQSDVGTEPPTTPLPEEHPSLGEPKTSSSLETTSSENSLTLKQHGATKRATSLTSEDSDEIFTKKRRGLRSEDVQEKRPRLIDGFYPPQRMDIVGNFVPATSNQAMEVETSDNTTLIFNLIPAALNTPLPGFSTQFNAASAGNDMEVSNPEVIPGDQGVIEDIEMSQSGINHVPLAFGYIHQLPTPIFGGQPFGQQAVQPSFGLNQPAHLQLFGSPQVPRFNVGNAFANVPTSPSLPTGILNKTGNPLFSFGNVPRQTTQPMSGVSFKQNSTRVFGNVPTRNTLVNADGTPRKVLSASRYRRRNVAKPGVQASKHTTPPVLANASQLGPRQGFGSFSTAFTPSPTPMESEDGSNVNIFLGSQPRKVLNMHNLQFVGHNKVVFVQSSLVQNMNDHPMEERMQPTPSMVGNNGTYPQLITCSSTSQAGTVIHRALSLSSRLESEAGKLQQQSIVVGDNQLGTLHKIYSSTLSVSSSSSTESDCESEIDAQIEGLAESVSNCSLDNCPELDDIGKLIEQFKTLSIADVAVDG